MPAAGSIGPILAADIGGGKASIGLVAGGATPSLRDARTCERRRYDSFEALLGEYLASRQPRPESAAPAVAGPDHGGTVRVTNLPRKLDGIQLCSEFGSADVALVNDVEALAVRGADGYVAHPREDGHADFAPRDALEIRLRAYLPSKFGHVSWERVASGSGLPTIHRSLIEIEDMVEVPSVAERLANAEDATPILIAAALRGAAIYGARGSVAQGDLP